jgi:hypothetical protein
LDEAAAPSAPSREFAAANRARPAADSSLVERLERRADSEKQLARAPEEQARQAAPPRDEAVRRQAPGLGEREALAPRAEAPAPRPLTGAESDVADALGSLAVAEPAPLKKKDAGKAGRTDAASPLRSTSRAMPAEAKLSEAAPGGGGAVLHLVAGRHVETALPGRRDLELRVSLPQGAPGGGEAQLRLVDASGRRELRERVPVAPGSGGGPPELAWRVPGSWLATGSYRLELMLPGAAAPLHFSFAVGGG